MLSNCKVMEGRGRMLVVAVGEHSEWGRMRALIDTDFVRYCWFPDLSLSSSSSS